jgi:hypothetical protein
VANQHPKHILQKALQPSQTAAHRHRIRIYDCFTPQTPTQQHRFTHFAVKLHVSVRPSSAREVTRIDVEEKR